MSLFEWNDRFSVHHDGIDDQHKELFRIANELHLAIYRGAGKPIVGKTLANLLQYTRTHFRSEEALMRRTNYPHYAAHKPLHDDFTARVVGLVQDFEEGRGTLTLETMLVVSEWLQDHIMVQDTRIGEHVAAACIFE